MKKSTQFVFTIIVTLITLFSCTNVSDKKDTKADTAKIAIDTAGLNQARVAEKILLPTDIKVKIFSEIQGYEDENGVSHKTKIVESPDVDGDGEIYFCEEDFSRIEIIGNGSNISFLVKKDDKIIFQKSNFEIKEKIKFTNRDFNFNYILGRYIFLIKQEDKTLFKKVIEYTTCD